MIGPRYLSALLLLFLLSPALGCEERPRRPVRARATPRPAAQVEHNEGGPFAPVVEGTAAAPAPERAASPAPPPPPPPEPVAAPRSRSRRTITAIDKPSTCGPAGAGERYSVTGVDPKDVLNVRAQPDPKAEIEGTLPPDATGIVDLHEKRRVGPGTWRKVRCRDLRGWVNEKFLAKQTD